MAREALQSGLSASDKLAHRQVLPAGTSPFADEPKAPPTDRTRIVSCAECHGRFLDDEFLASHIADKHACPTSARARESAAEVERVVDLILDRFGDGSLKPGQVINQGVLADQVGVTRYFIHLAVEELVKAGLAHVVGGPDHRNRRVIVGQPPAED